MDMKRNRSLICHTRIHSTSTLTIPHSCCHHVCPPPVPVLSHSLFLSPPPHFCPSSTPIPCPYSPVQPWEGLIHNPVPPTWPQTRKPCPLVSLAGYRFEASVWHFQTMVWLPKSPRTFLSNNLVCGPEQLEIGPLSSDPQSCRGWGNIVFGVSENPREHSYNKQWVIDIHDRQEARCPMACSPMGR